MYILSKTVNSRVLFKRFLEKGALLCCWQCWIQGGGGGKIDGYYPSSIMRCPSRKSWDFLLSKAQFPPQNSKMTSRVTNSIPEKTSNLVKANHVQKQNLNYLNFAILINYEDNNSYRSQKCLSLFHIFIFFCKIAYI